MTSYTPTTYVVETVPRPLLSAPVGPPPAPLPSSQNYVRPVKQKQSFGAKLGAAWDKLTVKAERSWNEQADERFRRYFGFPYTEELYGEFWGEVWTGGQIVPCSVYLSSNFVCIEAKIRDPATRTKLPLKFHFSLSDIVNVQRAIALPASHGGTPVIQPVTDPSVRADSLQVFTRDGRLHQFAAFYNYDKFVSTLDYLWRLHSTSSQAGGQPQQYPGQQPAPLNQTAGYAPQTTKY